MDVRRQLDAEKRLFGYTYHPDPAVDAAFTAELARVINDMGIGDIRDIGLYTATTTRQETGIVDYREAGDSGTIPIYGMVTVPTVEGYFFNRRTNARLNTSLLVGRVCRETESQTECVDYPAPDPAGPADFYTVRGPDRWVGVMRAAFTPDGIVFFLPYPYREQSSWQSFREALTFFFGVASFAIPGLGAAIGQYVFGAQVAANYPALVSIATQTAFNAVLGGADIETAVSRALANYAGGGIGDIVGAQFDSQLLGKLTSAATTARLNDADVQQAVSMALLQAGASGTIALPTTPATVAPTVTQGDAMEFDVDLFPTNVYEAQPASEPVFADAGSAADPYGAFLPAAFGDGDYMFGGLDPFTSNMADFGDINQAGAPVFGGSDFGTFDPSGGDYGVTPTVSTPPIADSGTDWDAILSTISKAALTAIQINKAYQSSGAPPIKVAPPSQTVNRNGTITTRTPTGTVATSKLPVGVPYALPDGSLILNNGDGTYQITAPNGAVTRGSYATSAAPGSGLSTQTALLLAAAGVGAVMLMRK